jgi:hypothetical protein
MVMAITHRMYGGAVMARVVVRLKLSPATTIGKKLVTEAAIYKLAIVPRSGLEDVRSSSGDIRKEAKS